jgi:hypothetical protein
MSHEITKNPINTYTQQERLSSTKRNDIITDNTLYDSNDISKESNNNVRNAKSNNKTNKKDIIIGNILYESNDHGNSTNNSSTKRLLYENNNEDQDFPLLYSKPKSNNKTNKKDVITDNILYESNSNPIDDNISKNILSKKTISVNKRKDEITDNDLYDLNKF